MNFTRYIIRYMMIPLFTCSVSAQVQMSIEFSDGISKISRNDTLLLSKLYKFNSSSPLTINITNPPNPKPLNEFTITKMIDYTTIPLTIKHLTGESIQSATISVIIPDFAIRRNLTYVLHDVFIKEISQSGPVDTDERKSEVVDTILLECATVEWKFNNDHYPELYNQDGWNFLSNTATPPGTSISNFKQLSAQ